MGKRHDVVLVGLDRRRRHALFALPCNRFRPCRHSFGPPGRRPRRPGQFRRSLPGRRWRRDLTDTQWQMLLLIGKSPGRASNAPSACSTDSAVTAALPAEAFAPPVEVVVHAAHRGRDRAGCGIRGADHWLPGFGPISRDPLRWPGKTRAVVRLPRAYGGGAGPVRGLVVDGCVPGGGHVINPRSRARASQWAQSVSAGRRRCELTW